MLRISLSRVSSFPQQNLAAKILLLAGISLDSCEIDPTHFSAARHHYQQTTESLLDERALVTFPEISKKALQDFRDTYGVSAFVCRYLHCVFSSDGFDSISNRA